MDFLEFSNYLYSHKSTRLGNTWEDWHKSLLDRDFNCQTNGNGIEYVRYILISNIQYRITVFESYDSIIMILKDIDSGNKHDAERVLRRDTTIDIIGEMFEECLNAFDEYL